MSVTPSGGSNGDAEDVEPLNILVAVEENADVGEKGWFSRGERDLTTVTMDPANLRRNLQSTLDALRVAFDGLTEVRAGLPLKEVQVSFEVSATGKITLLGTGAEVTGTGGITLTFGQ
jgi:hypothetical protein